MLGSVALAGGLGRRARAADPLRRVTIQVANYNDGMSGAAWAVALDRGFLRDQGLDVEIRSSTGGSADVRNLMAGDLAYVESAVPPVATATRQGAELRMVADNVRSFGSTFWFAKATSPVNSVRDLKGRTLSYSNPQSATHMLAVMLVNKLGLARGDVRLLAGGGMGPQLTLLESGAVDVVTAGNQIFHAAPAGKYKLIGRVAEELPTITNVVGVTTTKAIREQPDVIRRLIAGRRQAVAFIRSNTAEAIDSMARVARWDREVTRQVVMDLVNIDFWGDGDFGTIDMDNAAAGIRLIGVMQETFDWRRFVDEQFLPPDLPRLAAR
jgi:NitT/TauT family transport system substrate-binding protein